MATRTQVEVTILSRNNRELAPTKGSLTEVTWDKKDQTKNAVKTLGMWLGFSFAAIFVPIAHYFLVPTLFITAFVLAMDKLSEAKRNEGGAGECPKCHQNFVIEKSKWAERLTDTCGSCHDDVEMLVSNSTEASVQN